MPRLHLDTVAMRRVRIHPCGHSGAALGAGMIVNHRGATPERREGPTKDPMMDDQNSQWYCPDGDCDYCGGAFTD